MKSLVSLWTVNLAVLAILVGIYFLIRYYLKKNGKPFRQWRPWVLAALIIAYLLVAVSFSSKWKEANATNCIISIDDITYSEYGDAVLQIEGDSTALTLNIEAGSEQLDIVLKADENYTTGTIIPNVQIAFNEILDKTTVRVWRLAGISEYYVEITSIASDGLEVSDNRESQFHEVRKDYLDLDISTFVYYAYIGDLDDSYILTIDGTDICLS